MNLNDKQRKWLWIAGAALALFHFGPGMIGSLRHAMQGTQAAVRKPSPSAPMVLRTLPPPPPPDPEAPFVALKGAWGGEQVHPDLTTCKWRLDMDVTAKRPASYMATSTLSCGQNLQIRQGMPVAADQLQRTRMMLQPAIGNYSGSVENGVLKLHLDQNVQASLDDCSPSTITITPLVNGMSGAYEETGDKCQGGAMAFRRLPR